MTPVKVVKPSEKEVNSALTNVAEQTQAKTLAETTMYLKLRFERLGNRRKVSTSQIEKVFGGEQDMTDAEKEAEKQYIQGSKKLFKSPELKAIRDFDSDTRRYVDSIAHSFDIGIRLVSTKAVDKVDEYLESRAKERKPLVAAFIKVYPELIEDASKRALFNPNEFIPVEAVEREFVFTWRWLNFGTPEKLKTISREIFKRETAKAQQDVQQAAAEIKDAMRAGLLEILTHLNDKLSPDENGGKKVLRSSAVANLQEFLKTFDLRNVTSDDELSAVVSQINAVMDGVDRNTLAVSDSIRARVQQQISQVVEKLDTMVVNRPGRKFRKELEEV